MMAVLVAASHLALAALSDVPRAGPPAILQVHREPLKPGALVEYGRLESDTAQKCAQLHCPHAYLALESVTGPKEVWWLNGYASDAERTQVADAWAASTEILDLLGRNARRKATLVGKGIESMARHRQDLSGGEPWQIGSGRFLVIWSGRGKPGLEGTAYETDDGTRLGFEYVVFRAERGGFPVSWASHVALTDETDDRALPDAEGHVVDRQDLPEAACDVGQPDRMVEEVGH